MSNSDLTLIDPKTKKEVLKIYSSTDAKTFRKLQRLEFFSLIWLKKGNGKLKVDFNEYMFENNMLFSFSPYQPFIIEATEIDAQVIHFHTDFFCIHKHQKEVSCDGVLFNNIYKAPMINVNTETGIKLNMFIEQMLNEMIQPQLAQYELLISYLKLLLITASRLKQEQEKEFERLSSQTKEPFVLKKVKDYIDEHYKTNHSPSDYADMLAISPKALGKLTKKHFNKTLTDLISERIIIEAKRELYLTNKSVKEIAYSLGYNDEYYFSRFFKKKASVSPQIFRRNVGLTGTTLA